MAAGVETLVIFRFQFILRLCKKGNLKIETHEKILSVCEKPVQFTG